MRKVWSLVAVLVLAGLVFSACAAPAPQIVEKEVKVVETVVVEVEKIVEKEVAPAAEPIPGMPDLVPGELTLAVKTHPDGIDPHQCAYNNCFIVSRKIADTLIAKAPDGSFKPFLAKSWEISEDGSSYTFMLRDDVTFHDGTPFNAEAVKANFDRVAAEETKSKLAAAYLGPYDSAEVIDEFTVRINFTRANAPFFNVFASNIPMLSPTAFNEMSLEEANWHPVGSGPFMFVEYVPNDSVVMVKNPDYNWAPEVYEHQGPAYLDKLVVKFIGEDATRAAALQSGEIQAVLGVPETSLPIFKAEPEKYTIVEAVMAGPGVHEVPNAGRAPLDDVLVRQALWYATNQEMINQTVYLGAGPVAFGVVSPQTPCYDEAANTMYSYDPEKAAALLDEAGWTLNASGLREKDGQLLQVVLNSVAVGKGPEIGEALQAQWAALGIDVRNQTLASAAIQVPVAQGGDFDIMWRDFGANDANILATLFHSKNIGPGKGWNFSHVVIPELDALLDEGELVSDPEARCKIYAEAQKIIAEQALLIPIKWRTAFLGSLKPVEGLIVDPTGILDFWVYDAKVAQ